MGRGTVATLPRDGQDEHDVRDAVPDPGKLVVTVERDGFNLHAGVRIAAGDDLGRERLCRYGARPPISLERLRRLPGGRIGYRLKYVERGRKGKHRVMTPMEFMARLAAIIAPPRYPLVRYGGVLAPRSIWRKLVVPRPRERTAECRDGGQRGAMAADGDSRVTLRRGDQGAETAPTYAPGPAPKPKPWQVAPRAASNECVVGGSHPDAPLGVATIAAPPAPGPSLGHVTLLAPNVIAVNHWNRLLGGLLYAVSPRIDWATLLRRSFQVDVLQCPQCNGRLRVLAVLTEREPVRRILAHLGIPTQAPPVARARDPTDDTVEHQEGQLPLQFV
jgi:hypothetical protein